MTVVEEYWSGVLRRLQAEVQVFNRLIHHSGEKGRANELSLAQIISRLVPRRYAVGSGILIDSHDNYSSQTDIVIFNQADDPAVLAQSTQVLFPVENVHLCIEVKTSVGKGEIEDARAKQKTVQDLRPIGTERPAYALVGFESESSVDTIAQHLRASPNLDIACILNEGIIAGPAQLLHAPDHEGKSDTNFTVGMACPPTEVAEAILQTADSADPRTPINVVEHGGANYSIVRRGRNRVVADPARALLLFCDALLRILSNSDSRSPAFSYYIDAEARKITALP